MRTDAGTYVYAIAREADVHLPDLVGVAGAPVQAITHAGLVAYVSAVPLDQFGEEPLRRSLEDLDWVEGTARAHHRVVEAVAEAAPTAPVRLATVYSGEEQVRDLLKRRHDDFVAVLSHIAGRKEWGVKAYVDPAAAPPAGGDEPAAAETTSPGTAYLKRRQASLRNREETWREAAAHAEHIHTTLTAVAVASRRHRPQDPQLSGRNEWMVLNGAYLVDDDREDEFAATLDTLRGQGIDVQLTGPWAPYSFTALELDRADEEARGTASEARGDS
ncbi:GvpL/GvpF family gas vesicle protein [Streptosporangium sp. NPDC000396]|uniref:GvpL/GvpF family gas vesicle protein n=1 Tax=Streptosporangium sp. NPDC000396 TaxID=3366185 RepID=UPI00367BB7FD